MIHKKPDVPIAGSNSISPTTAKLLTPSEFSEGMPFSVGTLNNSRLTGRLMGVAAPKHYRFGRKVRYPLSERDAWLQRFQLASTFTEHHFNKSEK